MVAISVNRVTKTFKRYEKQERILDNFFHRKYLEKVAVDNVSFQINKGECVAVIGQNGAGKTTMMKLMSGLLLPTTGKIEVLNYNPFKKEKAYKKSITLLLGQKQQLWWDVSAKDNYLLLKDIYELRDKEYEKNLSELVEMIGAEDILQSPVRTLSLGERMKCELIGSLLYKPEILFLDEPTIGMDLIAQKEVREFIKNYSINNKATVILTSHNMGDIEAVCERAIFMDKGKIYYDGNRSDEIQTLGQNMNYMSDRLEKAIYELQEANELLKEDIKRKEAIDEMRKDFIANVSHELKTPIALIQGYAEGLNEGLCEDEESRKYYTEVILDESEKMNNMVKQLLTLSSLESGNSILHKENFNLTSLIESVLSSISILIGEKDVNIIFDSSKDIYIHADEFKIEEVVTNYISNSINHVKDSGEIKINVSDDGENISFSVYNTGNPIPEKDLNNIWEKFFKVDKAHSRAYGGSGIGLSIVKAIVEAHNGTVAVKNILDGVEFSFKIPKA